MYLFKFVDAEAVGLDVDVGTLWLFMYWLLFIYSVSGVVEIESPRRCSQIQSLQLKADSSPSYSITEYNQMTNAFKAPKHVKTNLFSHDLSQFFFKFSINFSWSM